MRRTVTLLLLAMVMAIPTLVLGDSSGDAQRVLDKYFQALGGLERLNAIRSAAMEVRLEAYDYGYRLALNADGRFRITQPEQTVIYDGKQYWMDFHGLVDELPEEGRERYSETTIRDIFFQGLLGTDGKPAEVTYQGVEEKHGSRFEVLGRKISTGSERTYYFDATSHLLTKVVVLQDDPDYRQLKTVYQIKDYIEVAGLRLPSKAEGICITNGENVLPLSSYQEIQLDQELDVADFTKPDGSIQPAVALDGVLKAQVLGTSARGSIMTSVTRPGLDALGFQQGDLVVAKIKDQEFRLRFIQDFATAGPVGNGDYIALVNQTPVLWLVKAYVGLAADVTVEAGDPVTITRESVPAEKGQ